MNNYGSTIENEQYYRAEIILDDGSHLFMMEDEKNHYYEMLRNCPVICDNVIVQMSLKKKDMLVEFNGLVAFKDKYGGFSTYGSIDLIRKRINLFISLNNDDRYDRYIVSFDKLNKGKVK